MVYISVFHQFSFRRTRTPTPNKVAQTLPALPPLHPAPTASPARQVIVNDGQLQSPQMISLVVMPTPQASASVPPPPIAQQPAAPNQALQEAANVPIVSLRAFLHLKASTMATVLSYGLVR